MTRGQITTVVASTMVGALLTGAVSADAQTRMRAAATTCHPIGFTVAMPVAPAGNVITDTEASTGGAGRFRTTGVGAISFYCPVTDLPTVLDITDLAVVNRVSVLYQTSSTTEPASAQVCSEDNAWSFGGSCSGATTATGAGARAIDINLDVRTNWHDNPNSLHYIFAYVPQGDTAAYFTGYTLWKI